MRPTVDAVALLTAWTGDLDSSPEDQGDMEVKGWDSGELLHGNAFLQHSPGAVQLDRMEQNPPFLWFLPSTLFF